MGHEVLMISEFLNNNWSSFVQHLLNHAPELENDEDKGEERANEIMNWLEKVN